MKSVEDGTRELRLSPEEVKSELSRRSRRGFLVGGVAALAGFGAYEWLTTAGEEDSVPWPQRRALALNEKLAHAYLSNRHRMPSYDASQVTYLKPNGKYGLDEDFDADAWQLNVIAEGLPPIRLQLSDIMALPNVTMTTRFCCIEGWDAIASWTGARFSDFTRRFAPPGNVLPYVYMATPDEEYYVGLDAKSAFHPQTLLAYQYNGKPLTPEHGAPLRLVIPVKYGIKNIKRIGSIRYTSKRPGDYWAEEGYDWFAGL
jgi:DMSO/TMAO reductase YedYZ molybdopterin-dependent catalytic subunit